MSKCTDCNGEKVIGQGTTLEALRPGTADDWVLICGLTGFNGPSASRGEVDVTDLCSTAKEYLLDLKDYGTVEASGFLMHGNAGQQLLQELFNTAEKTKFRLTLVDDGYGNGEVELLFEARVQSAPITVALAAANQISFTLRITGEVETVYPGEIKSLTFNIYTLMVDAAGTVTGEISASLTGETFTGTTGAALPGVTFTGLPTGLAGVATRTGDTTATVSFSGAATSMAGGESVSVTVTFGDASFTGGSAAAVTGVSRVVTLKKAQPGPGPDPYEGLKAIKSVVFMGDSNGPQVGHSAFTSASITAGVLNYVTPAQFSVGVPVEIQGSAQNANLRGVVTNNAGAGQPSTARMIDTEYEGELTSKDSLSVALQYAIKTPEGIFGLAAGRTKKYPYIKHWGARGSMTAAQILARTPLEVLPHKPSHAIYMCGTNDVGAGTPDAEVVQTLKDCASLCTAQGIQVLLYAVPPRAASSGAAMAASTRAINAAIKEWCATQADVFFVDIHTPLADAATGFALPGILSDAVHLTTLGFSEAARVLEPVFEQYAVDYLEGAVNRIGNQGFSQTAAASSGFTGIMPTGAGLSKSTGATFACESRVENGEWILDVSEGQAGEYVLAYFGATDAATVQTQASRQTVVAEVMLSDEVSYQINGNFILNGPATSFGTSMFNGSLMPDEWFRVAGRDIIVEAGDNFGMNRPHMRIYVPESGSVSIRLRNFGFLTLAE